MDINKTHPFLLLWNLQVVGEIMFLKYFIDEAISRQYFRDRNERETILDIFSIL